ncbi:glutathione S-transferase family protein [Pseudochelatococcus sp. B33]
MGELIAGVWQRAGFSIDAETGTLKRPPSIFRSWITPDGTAGQGKRGFKAEAGRYHLYVSLACPWAHRTLIMRNLKGLADIISVSVVHWLMGADGWTFNPGPGVISDTVNGTAKLHEIYTLADPVCTSRVTVPVLWDKKERTIVSNESSEIIRMFNSAFDHLGAREGDYYPAHLRAEIDDVNGRVYDNLNNGVYKTGFATTQAAYEREVAAIFETLDWLEARLAQQRYLVGGQLTEADIRLLPTLLRFDPVYFGHFKCNLRALVDYPALWAYTRRLFQHPDIRPTVDFRHIKSHYYASHTFLNPSGIVPVGPERDFDAPVDPQATFSPV